MVGDLSTSAPYGSILAYMDAGCDARIDVVVEEVAVACAAAKSSFTMLLSVLLLLLNSGRASSVSRVLNVPCQLQFNQPAASPVALL